MGKITEKQLTTDELTVLRCIFDISLKTRAPVIYRDVEDQLHIPEKIVKKITNGLFRSGFLRASGVNTYSRCGNYPRTKTGVELSDAGKKHLQTHQTLS